MDPAALAGLCLLLARGETPGSLPTGVSCPPTVVQVQALDGVALASKVATPEARDAIARVPFAEPGNQGDSGLAGVVYTILNRLADGRWGGTVDGVLNARSQFEPVMRVGGDWRALPGVSAPDQARVETILNLALEGRLPDLTGGARFFQNAATVSARARAGKVSPDLVNFGGQTPSAVIGAHSFYVGRDGGGAGKSAAARSPTMTGAGSLFVGENRANPVTETPNATEASTAPGLTTVADPSRGLFVTADGVVKAETR